MGSRDSLLLLVVVDLNRLLLCFFDGITETEINDTPNCLEVTNVPSDNRGTNLACQNHNTNIIVLSWIYSNLVTQQG